MKLRILNDVHAGVTRSAGTTPATQYSLKQHIQSKFNSLLPESDLMILGDLFDKGTVSSADMLVMHTSLAQWLTKGHRLTLVSGNHDEVRVSTDLSSFDLLASLLKSLAPEQVQVIKGGGQMTPHGYVVPHMANQDLFDLELSKVPDCSFLFVHVNIDNNFAAQSDQSLNMSRAQIEACKAEQIICAHEHDKRKYGRVLIPGNQIASSCSDWQSPQDKYYTDITDGVVSFTTSSVRDTEYTEMDWQALVVTDHKFVKVVGTATSEQAATAINAINKLRKEHPAFVISNGITVVSAEGVATTFDENLQAVQGFSVWEALREVLTAEEISILEGLQNA